MGECEFKLKRFYHKLIRDGCFPVRYIIIQGSIFPENIVEIYQEIEFAPKNATMEYIEHNMFTPWCRQQYSIHNIYGKSVYKGWDIITDFSVITSNWNRTGKGYT